MEMYLRWAWKAVSKRNVAAADSVFQATCGLSSSITGAINLSPSVIHKEFFTIFEYRGFPLESLVANWASRDDIPGTRETRVARTSKPASNPLERCSGDFDFIAVLYA